MNGLVADVAEAEAILKRAKWSATHYFDVNNDADSNDGSYDHNTNIWDGEQSCFSNVGRKRPAERYSCNSLSPGKHDNSSQSVSPVKKKAKFNIHEKLRELYEELSSDEVLQANYQGLKVNSYLLEKLLSRVNLNVLIINLYPGNKGYSLSLKINGDIRMLSPPTDGTSMNFRSEETLLETARWPYEEEDLLNCIDNEELPIVLLDLLEAEYSCLFYSGCIIAQIRDFRQAYPSFVCDTHHVLLKPTTQSIINDVNAIVRSGSWGREEKLFLESALILATAPPLCLEPRPAVGLLAARLHHQRHLLATPDIRRQAKRYSQVAINRKRRLDQLTHYHGLGLLDLINKQRARAASTLRHTGTGAPSSRPSSKFPKKPSEVLCAILPPRVESPTLIAPPDVSNLIARLARPYERPRPSSDCAPQLVEEYILETDRGPNSTNPNTIPGVFHIKLSILQRPSNQEFLGELYVDRDYVEGERNGSSCRFPLGTRTHANRYIQQFTEIFTEEGRKSVRIKHHIPGQHPKISYTPAMRESNQSIRTQALAASVAANSASLSSGSSLPTQGSIGAGLSQHGIVGTIKVPSQSPAIPSPTSVVAAPVPSPEVVLVTGPGTATTRRTISASLPLLQAQLQAGPQTVQQLQASQQVASPAQSVTSQLEHAVASLKSQPQTLNSIHHIQLHQSGLKQNNEQQLQTVQITTPQSATQIQQLQNAQQTANQLLAQQLTNPPQPINPHKLQPAIIHIQHSLPSQLLQQKVGTSQPQIQTQGHHVTLQTQSGITLQGQPSISLQGQQGISVQNQQGITFQNSTGISLQAQNVTLQNQANISLTSPQGNTISSPVTQVQKVVPPKQKPTNPAISALVTSLMNSAYQFQQQAAANAAAKSSTNSVNTPNTPTNNATILNLLNSAPAAMTNTVANSAVLSDGITTKKTAPTSALLERLMAPPAPATSSQQTTQQLGIIPQLQNVQVQIPGLTQPISLSLNVSSPAGGSTGLLVSVPVSQPNPPSTQSLLQLPVTHLMAGNVKAGTPLQLIQRSRVAPRQLPAKLPTATVPSGTVQYISQQSTSSMNHQQRRRSNPNEPSK